MDRRQQENQNSADRLTAPDVSLLRGPTVSHTRSGGATGELLDDSVLGAVIARAKNNSSEVELSGAIARSRRDTS
jgi:hypothetical protein